MLAEVGAAAAELEAIVWKTPPEAAGGLLAALEARLGAVLPEEELCAGGDAAGLEPDDPDEPPLIPLTG